MKYYDTYAEAKAAYPDCDAVVTSAPNCQFESIIGKFSPVKIDRNAGDGFVHCANTGNQPRIDDDTWMIATPPKTRTEYVKVTESIFDLKHWFRNGALYYSHAGHDDPETMEPVEDLRELVDEHVNGNLYRRIEKEVDWRDEVEKFACKNSTFTKPEGCGSWNFGNRVISDDNFLEMCRVALRATGELE